MVTNAVLQILVGAAIDPALLSAALDVVGPLSPDQQADLAARIGNAAATYRSAVMAGPQLTASEQRDQLDKIEKTGTDFLEAMGVKDVGLLQRKVAEPGGAKRCGQAAERPMFHPVVIRWLVTEVSRVVEERRTAYQPVHMDTLLFAVSDVIEAAKRGRRKFTAGVKSDRAMQRHLGRTPKVVLLYSIFDAYEAVSSSERQDLLLDERARRFIRAALRQWAAESSGVRPAVTNWRPQTLLPYPPIGPIRG